MLAIPYMSSTEETHECEECDTSKEELEKHNKEEHTY
jgi:hypothetical protein